MRTFNQVLQRRPLKHLLNVQKRVLLDNPTGGRPPGAHLRRGRGGEGRPRISSGWSRRSASARWLPSLSSTMCGARRRPSPGTGKTALDVTTEKILAKMGHVRHGHVLLTMHDDLVGRYAPAAPAVHGTKREMPWGDAVPPPCNYVPAGVPHHGSLQSHPKRDVTLPSRSNASQMFVPFCSSLIRLSDTSLSVPSVPGTAPRAPHTHRSV